MPTKSVTFNLDNNTKPKTSLDQIRADIDQMKKDVTELENRQLIKRLETIYSQYDKEAKAKLYFIDLKLNNAATPMQHNKNNPDYNKLVDEVHAKAKFVGLVIDRAKEQLNKAPGCPISLHEAMVVPTYQIPDCIYSEGSRDSVRLNTLKKEIAKRIRSTQNSQIKETTPTKNQHKNRVGSTIRFLRKQMNHSSARSLPKAIKKLHKKARKSALHMFHTDNTCKDSRTSKVAKPVSQSTKTAPDSSDQTYINQILDSAVSSGSNNKLSNRLTTLLRNETNEQRAKFIFAVLVEVKRQQKNHPNLPVSLDAAINQADYNAQWNKDLTTKQVSETRARNVEFKNYIARQMVGRKRKTP